MELVLWYPKDGTFKLKGYSDADFAGSRVDRKSMFGTYLFLGECQVSLYREKQASVRFSTVKAENTSAGSCLA